MILLHICTKLLVIHAMYGHTVYAHVHIHVVAQCLTCLFTAPLRLQCRYSVDTAQHVSSLLVY